MTDKDKIKAEIERIMAEEMSLFEEQCQGGFEPSPSSPVVYTRMQMLLKFINSLPEEPVSNDLEEAAKSILKNIEPDACDTINKGSLNEREEPAWSEELVLTAIKAGAQWQKQQTINKAIVYNDKIYPITYENEPTEFCLDGGEEIRLITEAVNNGLLKQGDKVKVIIIKDD